VVQLPGEVRRFSFLQKVQTSSGALPASCSTILGAFHPGTKQPGREAGHLPLTLAEIRNEVEPYLHSPHIPLFCAQGLLYFTLFYCEINGEFFRAASGTGWNGHH